jgi:hypothetical protein
LINSSSGDLLSIVVRYRNTPVRTKKNRKDKKRLFILWD